MQTEQLKCSLATPADMMRVFEWANDPGTRSNSFSSELISLEDHISWFTNKITDPNTLFLICSGADGFVGQVRFDKKGDNRYVISFSVAPDMRGKGYGVKMVQAGISQFTKTVGPGQVIVGYVKETNQASMKIFQRLEFSQKRSGEMPDAFEFEHTY